MTVESYPLTLGTPLKIDYVTYLWCNDGWCYIPEIDIRRKYHTTENPSELNITEEKWNGVFPVCEYLELVEMELYSKSPLIWKETILGSSELYVETTETQTKNKKTRDRQQPLQD